MCVCVCVCVCIPPGQGKRPGFDPWVRKMPWSRKLQPTPVFLPGKFPGQRSLAGYSPWGLKESDTTEWLECARTHTHTHTHTHTKPGQDTVFPVSSYLFSAHALPLLFCYLREVSKIFSSHLANVWRTYFSSETYYALYPVDAIERYSPLRGWDGPLVLNGLIQQAWGWILGALLSAGFKHGGNQVKGSAVLCISMPTEPRRPIYL